MFVTFVTALLTNDFRKIMSLAMQLLLRKSAQLHIINGKLWRDGARANCII